MAKRRPARRRQQDSAALGWGAAFVVAFFLLMLLVSLVAAHPLIAALVTLAAVGGGVALAVNRYKVRQQQRAICAARAQHIGSYLQMSPGEFERALAYLCERDGCTQVRVVGGAGDLAADVIATTPSGHRIVIQAKRYGPTMTVGSGDVQKVNGTYQHAHGAHVAAIVTTSRFTKPAREYAGRCGIRLFDREALAGWASRTGPAPWH